MNKATLLDQLRIERETAAPLAPSRPKGRLYAGVGIAAVVALAGGAGAWALSRSQAAPVVATTIARPASISGGGGSLLDATGYVIAHRQSTVSSKITGQVMQVAIEEGQPVKQGQVMARLDDVSSRATLAQSQADALAARASIDVAQVALAQAQLADARSQQLRQGGYSTQQAADAAGAAVNTARSNLELARSRYAAAEAATRVAQRALDDTVVRAPFDGIVTVKAAQPGEIVSPVSGGGGFTRTGIGTVVDMKSLEVQVDVAESNINRVVPGMPVSVRLDAYQDWTIPAQVIAVVPTADRSKATVTVRIGFKALDRRILPEMGAHVSFLDHAAPASEAAPRGGAVVPVASLHTQGAQTFAFVVKDGRLAQRNVTLGERRGGGDQVVTSGLSAGEVVAMGEALRDGEKVTLHGGA